MNKIIAKNDKEWHRLVCEREGYKCQYCNKDYSLAVYFDENGVNQYVGGHHYLRKAAHPKLRLTVSNGRCTCRICHNKIHLGQLKPN